MAKKPTMHEAIQKAQYRVWDAKHILEDIFKKDDATSLPFGHKLVDIYDTLNETLDILEPFMQ